MPQNHMQMALNGYLGEVIMVLISRKTETECSARFVEVATRHNEMHCLKRSTRKTETGYQSTVWFTEHAPAAAS
jgi:hypothetical protein